MPLLPELVLKILVLSEKSLLSSNRRLFNFRDPKEHDHVRHEARARIAANG